MSKLSVKTPKRAFSFDPIFFLSLSLIKLSFMLGRQEDFRIPNNSPEFFPHAGSVIIMTSRGPGKRTVTRGSSNGPLTWRPILLRYQPTSTSTRNPSFCMLVGLQLKKKTSIQLANAGHGMKATMEWGRAGQLYLVHTKDDRFPGYAGSHSRTWNRCGHGPIIWLDRSCFGFW